MLPKFQCNSINGPVFDFLISCSTSTSPRPMLSCNLKLHWFWFFGKIKIIFRRQKIIQKSFYFGKSKSFFPEDKKSFYFRKSKSFRKIKIKINWFFWENQNHKIILKINDFPATLENYILYCLNFILPQPWGEPWARTR